MDKSYGITYKVLIIYEKHEMLKDFVDYLKEFADVYITSNVQDTLNYISTYPYSLFLIYN